MEPRSKVRWAPRARQDLLDHWEYLSSAAGHEVADNLVRDIDKTIDRLAEVDPAMYQPHHDLISELSGLRIAHAHPYGIFYRYEKKENVVEIVRIIHLQRRLHDDRLNDDL